MVVRVMPVSNPHFGVSEYTETLSEFIANEADNSGADRHLYRTWDDIDQSDDSPEVLQAVAEAFGERVQTRMGEGIAVSLQAQELLPVLPDIHDPSIWRVRVRVRFRQLIRALTSLSSYPQKGLERDVVLVILQKALKGFAASILSAFTRDRLTGDVFVEALKISSVNEALTGVHGILRPVSIDLVSLSDRVALLNMASPPTIKLYSWVRIRRPGKYRGDLACVCEVDDCTSLVYAVLVPRIPLDKKRKRASKRPPACLFDSNAIESAYPGEIKLRNTVWLFRGGLYKDGLLEEELTHHDITFGDVYGTERELELFRISKHPQVKEALKQATVPLQIGDKIQVVEGTFAGILGRLVDIRDDLTVVFQTDDLDVRHQVYAYEVRKRFSLGELVLVLHGPHKGEQGYITHMSGDTAVLYKRNFMIDGDV